MNYNKPLTPGQREMLAQVSPRKVHTPKLYDPTTGTSSTKFAKELPRTGMYDNMPIRGNWKDHS